MEPQTVEVDVVAVAVRALVRALSRVQPFVQLQVDELCKLGRADLALVGFFTRVQPQVGLQVASAAETLVTHLRVQSGVLGSVRRTMFRMRFCLSHLALVGFLSCVDQVVFLQVGQLGETFIAGLTLKGSLTTMDTQVHLRKKKI